MADTRSSCQRSLTASKAEEGSMYQRAAVIGSVEGGIHLVVSGYQSNHAGSLPAAVIVPRDKMPQRQVVDGWRLRGVDLVQGARDGWEVHTR